MTRIDDRAGYQNHPKWMDDDRQRADELDIERPSPERTRTANEVGSAIAHQLNGPLTALRLYVGEIRQNSRQPHETAGTQDSMQEIIERAFQETERVCAMIKLIADRFEEPLDPETAAALGRDVIGWWSRNSNTGDGVPAEATSSQSVHALLTPREREVLGHVSQGCSNKQGAIRMQIAPRTFESHRARVMRKFGARNAADLVRKALGENSVTP
jgi:DNA-binding CsgD family transcriptional regulator